MNSSPYSAHSGTLMVLGSSTSRLKWDFARSIAFIKLPYRWLKLNGCLRQCAGAFEGKGGFHQPIERGLACDVCHNRGAGK